MAKWKNEAEAREQIKELVTEYYHEFKESKVPYKEGDRICTCQQILDTKIKNLY